MILGLLLNFLISGSFDSASPALHDEPPVCCELKYHWLTQPLVPPGIPPFPIAFGESTLTLTPEGAGNAMRLLITGAQLNDFVSYDAIGRESQFKVSNATLSISYPADASANASDLVFSVGNQQIAFSSTSTEDHATHERTVAGRIYLTVTPENYVKFEETMKGGAVLHASFHVYRETESEIGRMFFTLEGSAQSAGFAFPTLYLACLASREFVHSKDTAWRPTECFPN